MNKKLIVWNLLAIGSSLLFSLLQLSFAGDISLVAFPLSVLFVVWFAYESHIGLIKNLRPTKLSLVVKLLQYLPYVLLASFVIRRAGITETAYWYDLVTVLLWVVVMVSSHGALYFLHRKRVFDKNPALKEVSNKSPKAPLPLVKKALFEALDWVDAFVQAICTVALINIFILQLYEIPSESMVSEFLVRDRVVGYKLDAGPKFPMSDVGLPEVRSYNRGDIVIFSNPHYSTDKDSQLKTFLSQLVYMLTLTTVNLNVDENGELKADPLVKRITGVEGEQLVMQDGVLYSRTTETPSFTPVTEDATWANWNLASLPPDVLKKVQYVPLRPEEYDIMIQIEADRKSLNFRDALQEARDLVARFEQVQSASRVSQSTVFNTNEYSGQNALFVYTFFSQADTTIRDMFYSNGGAEWFSSFMLEWASSIPQAFPMDFEILIGGDMYTDAMFRQNLMLKLAFGRLAVRTAELLSQGVSTNTQSYDQERLQYMMQAQNTAFYILNINDMRNMGVFPPNDDKGDAQYIDKDHFFVMGDNRFNSLDMRHSYDRKRIPLTHLDSHSFYYDSNLAPQQISTDNILGTPVLRFFPFSRFGIPGSGGEK